MKKKLNYLILLVAFIGASIMIANGCKKDKDSDTDKPAATPTLPVITTSLVSDSTQTTATCGGNVTADGGASVTSRGVCWGTVATPTITNSKTTDGTGTGSFTSTITGLTANTKYYVCAYATNSVGTAYGAIKTFYTKQNLLVPDVSTSNILTIGQTTATGGGSITTDGGAAITEKGVCWSITSPPTITDSKTSDGSGLASFSSSITGLTPSTKYYVRAYATNSVGTGYGSEKYFTTDMGGELVSDYDGNVYHTVTIGSQVWTVENLKTTHFRNGDLIPNVTDIAAWSVLTTPAQCVYDNLAANGTTYGRLYTYYAVADARNICPIGYHIPTDAEWKTLTDFLGGKAVAGGKLKETGVSHWIAPNTGATNETGFKALPGDSRGSDGYFTTLGTYGYWWSATAFNATSSWARIMNATSVAVSENYAPKNSGFSVRCVKD